MSMLLVFKISCFIGYHINLILKCSDFECKIRPLRETISANHILTASLKLTGKSRTLIYSRILVWNLDLD